MTEVIALSDVLQKMHALFKKHRSLMVYVPTPCFTAVTDEEEDMAEVDDC